MQLLAGHHLSAASDSAAVAVARSRIPSHSYSHYYVCVSCRAGKQILYCIHDSVPRQDEDPGAHAIG